jgi:hypothetical protein
MDWSKIGWKFLPQTRSARNGLEEVRMKIPSKNMECKEWTGLCYLRLGTSVGL